jgi:hypothetical protein
MGIQFRVDYLVFTEEKWMSDFGLPRHLDFPHVWTDVRSRYCLQSPIISTANRAIPYRLPQTNDHRVRGAHACVCVLPLPFDIFISH